MLCVLVDSCTDLANVSFLSFVINRVRLLEVKNWKLRYNFILKRRLISWSSTHPIVVKSDFDIYWLIYAGFIWKISVWLRWGISILTRGKCPIITRPTIFYNWCTVIYWLFFHRVVLLSHFMRLNFIISFV